MGILQVFSDISCGIRQGFPVFGLLHVLSVEVITMKIRKCQLLKGFNDLDAKTVNGVRWLRGTESKISRSGALHLLTVMYKSIRLFSCHTG